MRIAVIPVSLSVLLLAACSMPAPLKKVEAREPIAIPAGTEVRPIEVRPIAVKLKFNEEWGVKGQPPGCIIHPGNTLLWRPEREGPFGRRFTSVLLRELEKSNYSATLDASTVETKGAEAGASMTSMPAPREKIVITGTVKKITLNLCNPVPYNRVYAYGESYLRTEWKIQAGANADTALQLVTEGSSKIDESQNGIEWVLLSNAFAVSVRNLLADPKFHTLVTGSQ